MMYGIGTLCLYCFLAFDNIVHSLNASTVVGRTWKARYTDTQPIDDIMSHRKGEWITGDNFLAHVLLSTTTTCSAALPFPKSGFGFGFVSYFNGDVSLGVFVGTNTEHDTNTAVVVWSANGDHLTDENSTLNLTADGNLVLKHGNGSLVWSANTSGRLVKSMHLTCEGNLILVNDTGGVVWQSFDNPTDTWLPAQKLHQGQRLTLSRGYFDVLVNGDGLHAFINAVAYSFTYYRWYNLVNPLVEFSQVTNIKTTHDFTYIRLQPNGHLIQFSYNGTESPLLDILHIDGGDCGYPTCCGNYGVCSDSLCGCPQNSAENTSYFRPLDPFRPDSGCTPLTHLTCSEESRKSQTFLRLDNVTYFGFESFLSLTGVDAESCKRACLENCSCVAAIFHYRENLSLGNCSLPSQVLTLMQTNPAWEYKASSFVKVQGQETQAPEGAHSSSLVPKLVASVSAFVFTVFCAAVFYYVTVIRREKDEWHSELVIDTVTRFSYESLRLATQDFQNKVGRGGFGSVFLGTLANGKEVAVKCLDSVGQGTKEFLAEVNSVGTLHHINLVKLIGFCEEGLHRLLVYEYMQNGSLDKWIFNRDLSQTVTWPLRLKIVYEIAKGLEYLHENCIQNVIHFDIKPQNILLDGDFNVKISDFGLAKMVNRDEAQVLTIIRGTPGYIAPELISGRAISVKVDVYSFGVMALEIVCGRKNIGSREEESLINLVKAKADEDRLSDLVGVRSDVDIQKYTEEAVKMMKIGIWCIQPHFIRPTMSMVVKVLQDLPNMETLTDLNYLTIASEHVLLEDDNSSSSTRPTESLLSGPR